MTLIKRLVGSRGRVGWGTLLGRRELVTDSSVVWIGCTLTSAWGRAGLGFLLEGGGTYWRAGMGGRAS